MKDCARPSRLARGRTTTKRRPALGGKQSPDNSSGTPLVLLAVVLEIAPLSQLVVDYLKLNVPHTMLPPALEEISSYRAQYYNHLSVPVTQFQGDEELIHVVRWTGNQEFRKRGKRRADWVWVHRRVCGPIELQTGQLDGRIIGRVEGLFSIQDRIYRVNEVALVKLVRQRGPAKPWGEESMIRMECAGENQGFHIIRVKDIEELTHQIPLEVGRVWLVNNRIDLTTWNELYA